MTFLKFRSHPVNDFLIKVITTQVIVSIGCLYFKNAIPKFQNGYVKCSATQVIDHNFVIGIFIQTISQRCCGWFIDNSQYFQTGNSSGIFGRLSLGITEVGRYGNNRFTDSFTQIRFGISLKLLQNHG